MIHSFFRTAVLVAAVLSGPGCGGGDASRASAEGGAAGRPGSGGSARDSGAGGAAGAAGGGGSAGMTDASSGGSAGMTDASSGGSAGMTDASSGGSAGMTDASSGGSAGMTDASDDSMANTGGSGGEDGAPQMCAQTAESCGVVPCVDCAGNALGRACVDRACGCNTAADCPAGTACDPSTKQCSTACTGGLTCNGGCCGGVSCVVGDDPGACGAAGAACKVCVGSVEGNRCVSVAGAVRTCGCTSASDCPVGMACDLATSSCTTSCASPATAALTGCHDGCCASGRCVAGTQSSACGDDGQSCQMCNLSNPRGTLCNPTAGGGLCGCTGSTDCAAPWTCGANDACTRDCDEGSDCGGGCCTGAVAGECRPGDEPTDCGWGVMCFDCRANAEGHVCVRGGCGCKISEDCPPNRVCGLDQKCGPA